MKFTAVLMFTYALAAPLPALNLGGVFKGASAQASRLTTALKPKTTFAKVGAGVVLGGAAVGGGVLLVNQLGKGPAVEAPDPNDPANAVDAQAAAGQG